MNDTRARSSEKRHPKPTFIVVGLAVVVIAAGGGWLLGHRQAAPTVRDSPDQLAAGQFDAAGVRGPALVGTNRDGRLPNGSADQAGTRDKGAKLLGLPSLSLDELKARQLQKQHQLVNDFGRDPVDPTAGTLELTMLKTMIDPALTGDRIAPGNPEVKCHRNSCRISADFNSSDDASSWAVNYLTMLGGKLGGSQPTMTVKPDGSVHMELYGTRQR